MQTIAYINIDSVLIKHLCRRMISRNVAVEFVAVFVPFDRIQRFPVHIEVALEANRVVPNHMVWYSNFSQSERFGKFCKDLKSI